MSKKQWLVWLGCFCSFSALAANGTSPNNQQRQQQLNSANSYAETVISTMQGLLQGYDASTLSSAFSQEITNLTNYANGLSGDVAPPSASHIEGNEKTLQTAPSNKSPKLQGPPADSFSITPQLKEDDVSTVPNVTGF